MIRLTYWRSAISTNVVLTALSINDRITKPRSMINSRRPAFVRGRGGGVGIMTRTGRVWPTATMRIAGASTSHVGRSVPSPLPGNRMYEPPRPADARRQPNSVSVSVLSKLSVLFMLCSFYFFCSRFCYVTKYCFFLFRFYYTFGVVARVRLLCKSQSFWF